MTSEISLLEKEMRLNCTFSVLSTWVNRGVPGEDLATHDRHNLPQMREVQNHHGLMGRLVNSNFFSVMNCGVQKK